MQYIEKEILDAIELYGMWVIILLVAIFIFMVGMYTLMKRLMKIEKQKREDRTIMLQKIDYTNQLLNRILDNQIQQGYNNQCTYNNQTNQPTTQEDKKTTTYNKWL